MNIAPASSFSSSIHIDLFAFGLRFVRAQEIEKEPWKKSIAGYAKRPIDYRCH